MQACMTDSEDSSGPEFSYREPEVTGERAKRDYRRSRCSHGGYRDDSVVKGKFTFSREARLSFHYSHGGS